MVLPAYKRKGRRRAALGQFDALQIGAGNTPFVFRESKEIADMSADATYYLLAPCAGKVTLVTGIVDGAISTADITITPSIAATPITGGVVTLATAASAAGTTASATPSAANTVAKGDKINFAVAGGGSGGAPRGRVTFEITPI